MERIMLDLETMGNNVNSAIIAIGAVKFCSKGIVDKFQTIVDLQSCLNIGLEVDGSTIIWWMSQDEDARLQFSKEGVHIKQALLLFSEWVGNNDDTEVWGNGAAFDNTILSNAYRKCGLVKPWKFWNDRCYRTVKNMRPDIKIKRIGVYHCAVDDAESQVEHLLRIEEDLKRK